MLWIQSYVGSMLLGSVLWVQSSGFNANAAVSEYVMSDARQTMYFSASDLDKSQTREFHSQYRHMTYATTNVRHVSNVSQTPSLYRLYLLVQSRKSQVLRF